ncbi:MAG TPA: 6,7-dimethyl-8-ribityllumazine synthase [Opitutales bacterium]|nr:6,7-dimethyl-8-ribityllumazine synthase [Opitutales bacterium]
MSLDAPSFQAIDGSGFRIAIVAARYNENYVDALVREACALLEASGAAEPLIERTPGSAELPYAASLLANAGGFDAIITIGVVIAGSTQHHKIIGESTAIALQELSIQSGVPVINGIIVAENQEQAAARAGTTINRGKEFAEAALEMAAFRKKWTTKQNQ